MKRLAGRWDISWIKQPVSKEMKRILGPDIVAEISQSGDFYVLDESGHDRTSNIKLHLSVSYAGFPQREGAYLTPFNFRPPLIFGRGWPKIRGAGKILLFFGWPKIKGTELGEGGRKLEGPKTKRAEN